MSAHGQPPVTGSRAATDDRCECGIYWSLRIGPPCAGCPRVADATPDRAAFLEGVTAERQRVLETARQWLGEGKLTRQEHGAICAVVLIDDRPLSEEQLKKVRARFLERFPDRAGRRDA